MKRFIISLICILSLYGITSCKKVEPPLGNSNNTDKTQVDNSSTSDLNSNTNINNVAIVQSKTTEESNAGNTTSGNQNGSYEYTNTGIIAPKMAENIIKPISDAVIKAIKNKDMETLASYVHPLLGVRFTPFTYVSTDQNVIFGPEKIKSFFQDTTRYQWGNYNGNGGMIELTPTQYYHEYIYSSDFIKADIIGYNTILAGGNTLNNLYEVYTNPIVVEYYFPGFKAQFEGLDWQSLSLVFEEYNATWYLVGIIHNSMDV